MENEENSVPVNLSSRPIERIVLKELNGITAAKSPKELADQTIIISNNCVADGRGEAAVNKNLLNVTTPTDAEEPSDPAMQSYSGVNSETFLQTTHVIESPSSFESFYLKESDATESVAERTSELAVNGNNLNETIITSHNGLHDATFVSANTQNDQTIVMTTGSLNGNIEATEDFTGPQLNQTQDIGEFKSNESLSANSLDGGAGNFSLDSTNINPDEPSTPEDRRLPVVSAEKLFSSRKAPTFSEMFASTSSPTINESNDATTDKQWNASFVVDRTYVTREKCPNTTVVLGSDDEKMSTELGLNGDAAEFDFKAPAIPTAGQSNKEKENGDHFIVLNSNDFDFLQSRGANSVDPENDPRSSLLLRFDPLTDRHSLLSTQLKQSAPIIAEGTDTTSTSSTNEQPSNGFLVQVADAMESDSNSCSNNVRIEKNGDKIISVDELLLTNKKIDTTSIDENIRRRMEEYEATQEILLKRITEKDKAITKASNVLELYEKAIAEALAAKEKLSQNYDKENEELKSDRDVTFQHLLSLESTFADLHMKFERNVQYTGQLQEKLNAVAGDKTKAEDLLRQQEFRYDKMKSHTMQQFDIANTKLEQQTRTISLDNTKLRAQIKREEIHKNAVAEELSQKKKENEELVKICDELISGQRN